MSNTLTRPLIQCPVCGQKMKRITATHLKKHDLTMAEFREKYGDIVATEPSQMLSLSDPETFKVITERVIGMIVTDEQIDDMSRTIIQNLMRDQDPRLRVGLNTAAIMKLRSFHGLYAKLETIQNALLDERRLANMTDSNLAKTYQIVEKSIDNTLSYLKSLSIDKDRKTGGLFEQNNTVNIFQQDPNAPPVPDSPAGREKLRALVSSLVRHAQGSISDVPALPDDDMIVEAEVLEVVVTDQEPADGSPTAETDAEAPDQAGDEGTSAEGQGIP